MLSENPILTSKREVGGCLSVVTLFESSSLTHQVASSKLILFRPDDHKFYELGVLLFESCNLKEWLETFVKGVEEFILTG